MQYTTKDFKGWGAEGGRRRGKKLSKKRRSEIARDAAKARWARRKALPPLP